jgi:prolyl-tRNA synthetase
VTTEANFSPPGDAVWVKATPDPGRWLIAHEDLSLPLGITLRNFNSALEVCEILDTGCGGLAGSFCLTPLGCRLLDFFAQAVHSVYRRFGFEEWSYPSLASATTVANYISALGLERRLVYASADRQFGTAPWVLCPTGEAMVYPHWATRIRTVEDLPIRMYRVAAYFRPAHGKHTEGIFRQIESSDIFECYAVSALRHQTVTDFERVLEMLEAALEACHVCSIRSRRPLATNNAKVSEKTIAFDAPLPTGKTIQLASAYLQGDRLSKLFGITYHHAGAARNTLHVTGYTSRRALLVHLLMGLRSDGTFTVHPAWQPVQALIVYKSADELDQAVFALRDRLVREGFRIAAQAVVNNEELRRIRKRHRRQTTGIDVIILSKRSVGDLYKIIVTRYDTGEETCLLMSDIARLGEVIPGVITSCERYHASVIRRFRENRTVKCDSLDQLKQILGTGRVALGHLHTDDASLKRMEAELKGEVLGFVEGQPPGSCLVTRKPVTTVAYVSRRM